MPKYIEGEEEYEGEYDEPEADTNFPPGLDEQEFLK